MKPVPGNILISQPFLNDGYFKRTVILLAEHNDNGSLGFVMNHSANLRVKDVVPGLEACLFPLHYGGPVAQNQMFYVHCASDRIHDSLPIIGSYYWGGDFMDVTEGLKNFKLKREEIKFFIGYSGWSAGQLEEEIQNNSWLISKPDFKNIMSDNLDDIWGNELKKMGSNYAVLANFKEDPSLN